ncbi:hypothetical protein LJC22_04975 [Desulfosarcina sp. OttesenSCG-928-G10]|nr:hypothetical protein [Desulfosarcina sp. OttesenSCG-928-G10]
MASKISFCFLVTLLKRGFCSGSRNWGALFQDPSQFKTAFLQDTDKCFGTRKLNVSENDIRSDASRKHVEPCPRGITYHYRGKAIPRHPHETAKSPFLSLCKEQYGIEQNFGSIKDPAIIGSIFLKRPERIEVLCLILLLSLLIWRLMEREMRRYLKRTGTQLIGWARHKTTQVTSFMLTTKFNKVRLYRGNGHLVLAQRFTDSQSAWLKALGVTPDDFLPPKSPQKIIKLPPEGY